MLNATCNYLVSPLEARLMSFRAPLYFGDEYPTAPLQAAQY